MLFIRGAAFGYVLQRLATYWLLAGAAKANGADKLPGATHSVGCTRHRRVKIPPLNRLSANEKRQLKTQLPWFSAQKSAGLRDPAQVTAYSRLSAVFSILPAGLRGSSSVRTCTRLGTL